MIVCPFFHNMIKKDAFEFSFRVEKRLDRISNYHSLTKKDIWYMSLSSEFRSLFFSGLNIETPKQELLYVLWCKRLALLLHVCKFWGNDIKVMSLCIWFYSNNGTERDFCIVEHWYGKIFLYHTCQKILKL